MVELCSQVHEAETAIGRFAFLLKVCLPSSDHTFLLRFAAKFMYGGQVMPMVDG